MSPVLPSSVYSPAWIRSSSTAEFGTNIIQSYGISAEIAARILTLYFEPERRVLPHRGEIDMKGFAEVIAFMGEAGLLKAPLPNAERFVDLQYLREVQRN